VLISKPTLPTALFPPSQRTQGWGTRLLDLDKNERQVAADDPPLEKEQTTTSFVERLVTSAGAEMAIN
jgi:hypothetical protein